jgi:enterochelin esterase-like enzyme
MPMKALDGLWSPQLRLLKQRLQEGDQTALSTFWERLASEGTPLVEPLDEHYCFVTLLWRDSKVHEASELTCALGGILNSRKLAPALFHLEHSDLWYRTFQLQRNVRATYHFFVNGEAVSDPLSQHVFTVPADPVSVFGDKEMELAIVELPDAAPERWDTLLSGAPRGNVSSQLMSSSIVGHDYRLSVYTPPEYHTGDTAYPLLLLYDEWTHTQVIPVPAILDTMIAAGKIPPLVAVLFGHIERKDRMREMALYEPFFAVLTQELLPWVHQHYAVTRDASQTTIAGASMGGIAAMYSGLRYPEYFGKIYSHIGSFYIAIKERRVYQYLEEMLLMHKGQNHTQRFYMDVGILECDEMGAGSPDGGPNAVQGNRIVRDLLMSHGYDVTYGEYPGGHDLLWGTATFVEALESLYHPGT